MASVRDILARKGSEVVAISAAASVLEAARLMNDRGIGGVVVTHEEQQEEQRREQVVGIFTERDILRRVVAEQRDPAATTVREVMTTPVLTCRPETSLEECGAIMTTRRLRHLPVLGDGGLTGMVTIGDLLAFQVAEQQTTIEELNRYLYSLR